MLRSMEQRIGITIYCTFIISLTVATADDSAEFRTADRDTCISGHTGSITAAKDRAELAS